MIQNNQTSLSPLRVHLISPHLTSFRLDKQGSAIHVQTPVHIAIDLSSPPDRKAVRHTTAAKDSEREDEDDDLRSTCDSLQVVSVMISIKRKGRENIPQSQS